MNPMLKIGAALLVFGLLFALLGAAVFRAHAHHPTPPSLADTPEHTASASVAPGSITPPPAK